MPITRCLKPDSIKGQDNRVNSNTETEVRELLALRRGPAESSSNRISIALSIDDAYHVQAKVLRLLNESVGGWKVAIGPEGRAIAAPLLASTIMPSGSTLSFTPDMKIETELAFKLKRDLPTRQSPYARQDVLDAISTVQCAFEIVQPRRGRDDIAFANFLADNLANGCTVLSAIEAHPGDALADSEAVIARDNTKIATGRHQFGDPILPILQYANAPGDHLGGLRSGQTVITGSFTGAIPVDAPAEYFGSIGTFAPVVVRFR
jgi:2-keto-4-pentenoate hydratase